MGQDPWAFAIAPDGQTIYVTNYQSGTVTPIRTATNTALAPICSVLGQLVINCPCEQNGGSVRVLSRLPRRSA